VWLGLFVLWLAKDIVFWLARRAFMPIETRLLTWLQDRATSRTLGIDIDVIRMRRKIEFTNH
jgi:uncharacterized membrane protein YfbV (UPF0208 family)